MATLQDAEAARRAHQERLGALGAHAIEIQPLTNRSGYELVVHFAESPPPGLPQSVTVPSHGSTASVPLRSVIRASR